MKKKEIKKLTKEQSVKEYDKLKEQGKYITDPTLIGMIDKMEFFLKELRKHIVRKL